MSTIVQRPDAELELNNEPWEFSVLGLWKKPDGFYLSTDSGCSCPTPWESHTEDVLTGPLTAEQAREEAQSLIDGGGGPISAEVDDFLAEIA